MSENEKPYMTEKRMHIPAEWLTSEGEPVKGLSVAQHKRLELITQMTQDRDPVEYKRIFLFVMAWVFLFALLHSAIHLSITSLLIVIVSLVYFLFVRKRLVSELSGLQQITDDFDLYLWEAYNLKEMRQSAVKLAVFLLFPLSFVFAGQLIFSAESSVTQIWFYILSYAINMAIWLFFFQEDTEYMDRLHSDLNALKYL